MRVIKVKSQTDIGIVRTNNEDCIRTEINNLGHQIVIVADGMGGHNAGEVASNLACEIVGNMFLEIRQKTDYKEFLKLSILEANKEIYKRSLLDCNLSKMGTTISILIYDTKNVYTGHIGDSRIYFVNKNKIEQITKDHTLVRAMMDSGNLEEGSEKYHKYKNILLQALGTSKKLTVELKQLSLPKEFCFLLCSDGLTGMVSDDYILEVMNEKIILEQKINKLIQHAKEVDGSDNVSILVIENRSEL